MSNASAFPEATSRTSLCAGIVVLLALILGCSTQKPRDPVVVDCATAERAYEFDVRQRFNEGDTVSWFGFGDESPRAIVPELPEIEAIEDVPERGADQPGRCGSTHALVIRASGFTDWGAGFGEYNTVLQPVMPFNQDGVAFWARTGENSDRAFFFTLDNAKTALVDAEDPELNDCVPESDAGTYPPGTDPRDACGNAFTYVVETTQHWQLFTIPWEDFYQEPKASRQPGGFDPTVRLVRFRLRFPTEARMELWLDDLGFYSRDE